jgi:adenylate cyclase
MGDRTLKILMLTVISAAVGIGIYLAGFLNLFELKAFDTYSRQFNPSESHDKVVMVEVDQQSIDAFSEQLSINWPWPRQIYAPILEYLSEAEAVFIDILFTEPSSYGHEDDLIMAGAVENASNVYLALFLTNQEKQLDEEDEAFLRRIALEDAIEADINFNSAIPPIGELERAVKGAGNVTISPDEDGVYRKVPLVFQLREHTIPHFIIGHLVEKDLIKIRENKIWLRDKALPLHDNKLLLRFYTNRDPFEVFSAADILNYYLQADSSTESEVPKSYFKGKYVFIGLTAAGLYDLKPTAVSSVSTGVMVHATALDNIINQTYITHVAKGYVIVFILIICFIVSFMVLKSYSIIINSSLFIVLLVVSVAVPAVMFRNTLYMDITPPAISLIISFVIAAVYSYATEGKKRKEVKNAFQHYVSPAVVDNILKEMEKLKLGGEKKELTALFSDIRGFTSISEGLDPEDLVKFLNEYFTVMTRIILNYQGTLDKFIGDAIMAFYGAPLEQKDHAVRACRTAVDMIQSLRELQADWEARKLPYIDIGIGLNSGDMTVGNMGSDERFDYTIMGDNVNLASRLEGINKVYGTNIVISQYTHELIKEDSFFIRELDSVRVKGKKEPVTIYELISYGLPEKNTQDAIELFKQGLGAYKQQNWDKAISILKEALSLKPDDKPSGLYIKRSEEYIINPPPGDWDGVYVMTTK